MDIRIDYAKKAEQPQPGWHQIEQDRLAYCTSQGDAFAIQFFMPGQLDVFDSRQMQDYERRARRLAWACLAEFGAPGPSKH